MLQLRDSLRRLDSILKVAKKERTMSSLPLQVDFYTDMDEDSDIAFRFRVHFGNHVVMNRREFGIWMLEETTDYVPFEDGKQFELCIYVHYNEYEIKVNGIRIYGFVHRIPPSFVKMVQVSRDISLTSVCVCN
eukprot:XP_011525176.1 galactoside-binding soluble lectin 13 isoform X2 [Homo sapiens]